MHCWIYLYFDPFSFLAIMSSLLVLLKSAPTDDAATTILDFWGQYWEYDERFPPDIAFAIEDRPENLVPHSL